MPLQNPDIALLATEIRTLKKLTIHVSQVIDSILERYFSKDEIRQINNQTSAEEVDLEKLRAELLDPEPPK